MKKDVGEEQDSIRSFKDAKDWEGLHHFMKDIVKADLRQIDLSDVLIVLIDTSIFMCGSFHEIVTAISQKKPILCIIKGGIANAPAWLFGIVDYKLMFNTIDECIDFLDMDTKRNSKIVSATNIVDRFDVY